LIERLKETLQVEKRPFWGGKPYWGREGKIITLGEKDT